MHMDVFAQAIEQIIKDQENIVGPVALEQAKKVHGLTVDWQKKEVTIEGNKKTVLDDLVKQYEHLFGKASVEVCKDAVQPFLKDIPKDQLPPVLAP